MSRITTDTTVISQLIMQVFLSILTTGYSTFVLLRRIGSYDGDLMWSLIAVLPINIVIAFVMGRMRFGANDLVKQRNAELTASVAERTNNIYRHVRKIMRGKTIIVVAHDMATVMDADYIIVLNQGSLEAAGTHKELLEKSPTYRGYLTKQGYILNQREEAEIR